MENFLLECWSRGKGVNNEDCNSKSYVVEGKKSESEHENIENW